MNIFKKIYCRGFQLCLKIALPFLPYKNPIIINGCRDIANALIKEGKKKPLIVTDNVVLKLNLLADTFDSLKRNNIEYTIFSNVEPNPTFENIHDALATYKNNNCDCFIAVGGGSVIDCAKATGALIAKPKKTLNQLGGILKIRKKIATLIAIPTTAGTGSETTLASVVVDKKTNHKYAINDFPLIPKYACLDYKMTMTLPDNLVSTTGMDALTHAIEAYIGRGGNKRTRRDALEAIYLIFNNLEASFFNKDINSRERMLYASHLAGRAFSKAYVGNVHALAHGLSGIYNTPHGLANAVILPIVLKEYGKTIYKKLYKIALYTKLVNKKCNKKEAAEIIINKIVEFNNKFNIPTTLNVNKNDVELLAKYAYKEANPLYPVPVIWDIKKLKEMYYKIGELHEWFRIRWFIK